MAKRKTSRRSRFAEDAALQALVRYEPEESGLKALAQQARADYGVSVRQAQTTGDLTLQAAREAIPSVAGIYDRAGLDQAKTASLVSPELAGIPGPQGATLQRGGALEVAQQLANLRASKASALEDLTTRQVAARQGQQFGVLNARQKFTADMQKILGQSQSLQRQKGAFTASTLNALGEKAAERSLSRRNALTSARTSRSNAASSRSQSERNSLRSSGIDPDTGKPIPGGRLDPKTKGKSTTPAGKKINPSGEHRTVRDEVGRAVSALKTLDPERDVSNWGSLGNLLQSGAKPQTLKDRTTGKDRIDRGGRPITTPEVPKVGSLSARVALDLYYHGGISRDTQRKLWNAGYSLKELGLAGKHARKKPLVPRLKNPFSTPVRG